ncbi:MAG: hypothetical protein ACFE9I_10600 [Candidatus Hermodarchaeota archaeon]
MSEKEIKLKIAKCKICGKEFSKHTRPWGMRTTCSNECNLIRISNIQKKGEEIGRATNKLKFCTICLVLTLFLVIFITILVVPQVIFKNHY